MSPVIPPGDLAHMADIVHRTAANATLTRIQAPGQPDRNGDTQPGPDLWTGQQPGFLARVQHEEVSGGQQVTVDTDTFTMVGHAAPLDTVSGPDWTASTITVVDQRAAQAVERTFRVVGVEHTAHGLLDSVLLTLDEVPGG
jgi:hypothetical protein